jgi:hypothetical protein
VAFGGVDAAGKYSVGRNIISFLHTGYYTNLTDVEFNGMPLITGTYARASFSRCSTRGRLGSASRSGGRISVRGTGRSFSSSSRGSWPSRPRVTVTCSSRSREQFLAPCLRRVGERDGTARLEGAVAAYWAAQQEDTRERVPLQ